MKALLYSDIHFYDDGEDRLKYQVETCGWIAELIEKYKPGLVANLGDTNDRHESMSISAIHAMGEGIGRIDAAVQGLDNWCPHLILMGNHDQYRRDGSVSIAPVLRFSERTMVVEDVYRPSKEVLAIAYHRSNEEFTERLNKISKRGRPKLLLIHQPVQGAYHRPGISDIHGADYKPLPETVCFAGHYHHPQTMEAFGSPYLFVIGSPCYYGWSDTINDHPRGCLLYDSDKHRWKRFENPHGPIYHTIYDLKANHLKPIGKRLNLRIVAQTTEMLERAKELKPKMERVFSSVSIQDRRDVEVEEESDIEDTSSINPEEIIESVVSQGDLDELQPEKLRKEGLDIMRSVR